MKRTHHCNELRKADAGSQANVIGWIDSIRDHGGILFVDLRDREGKTQLVLDPDKPELAEIFPQLKPESVVEASGEVCERDGETTNPNLPTGEVEIHVVTLTIHNQSKTPPFPLDDEADRVGEDLRLAHRYLDLRRPANLDTLTLPPLLPLPLIPGIPSIYQVQCRIS